MKKVLLMLLSVVIALSFSIVAVGCGETDPEITLTLGQTTATLEVGDTLDLAEGAEVSGTNDAIVWTTSNDAVATVSDGEVTAVASGEATITASVGGKTATCTVTVLAEKVTIAKGAVQNGTLTATSGARIGETITITATANAGYEIASIIVDGAPVTHTNGVYTFTATKSIYQISAVFASLDVTVTINDGESITGGTATLVDDDLTKGDEATITITADTGYQLKSVLLDGDDVTAEVENGTLTFDTTQSNHAVVVEFEAKASIISVNGGATVENGTVSVTEDVKWFDEVTVTFVPSVGYQLKSVLLDGEDVTADVVANVLTFTAGADEHAIVVEYEIKDVILTVNDGETVVGGTVNVTENVKWGETVTVIVTPVQNALIDWVKIDGEVIELNEGEYTFTAEADSYAIEVAFVGEELVVRTSAVNGTVTVDTEPPRFFADITVSLEPDTNYAFSTLTVDGEDVTAEVVDGKYTFRGTLAEHDVEATFVRAIAGVSSVAGYTTHLTGMNLSSAKAFEGITLAVGEPFVIKADVRPDGTNWPSAGFFVGTDGSYETDGKDSELQPATITRYNNVYFNIRKDCDAENNITYDMFVGNGPVWPNILSKAFTPVGAFGTAEHDTTFEFVLIYDGENYIALIDEVVQFVISQDTVFGGKSIKEWINGDTETPNIKVGFANEHGGIFSNWDVQVGETALAYYTIAANANGFSDGEAQLVINGKDLRTVTIEDGKFGIILGKEEYDFELVQGDKFDILTKPAGSLAWTANFVAENSSKYRLSSIVNLNGNTILQSNITPEMITDSLDGSITYTMKKRNIILGGTATTEDFIWEANLTSTAGAEMPGISIHNGTAYIYFQVAAWENGGQNIVFGVYQGGNNDRVYVITNDNNMNNLYFKVIRTSDKIELWVKKGGVDTLAMTATASGFVFNMGGTAGGEQNAGIHNERLPGFFGSNVELAVGYYDNMTTPEYTCTSVFNEVEFISASGTLTAKTVNGAEGNLSLYGSAVKMTFTHENGYAFAVNGVGVNGAFAFDEIVAGTYTVTVAHPNGATVTIEDVEVGSEAIALTANVLPEPLTASNAMTVNGLTATAGSYATTNGSTVTTSEKTNVFLPGTVTDKDFIFEASVTAALTDKFVFAIVPGTKQDKGGRGYDRIEFHIKTWDGQLGMAVRQEDWHGVDDFSTSEIPGAIGQNSNFKIRIERIDNELTVYVARQVGVVDAPFVKVVTLNTSGVQLQPDYSIIYTFSGLSFDTVNARLANMLASSTEELGVMMVAPACESTVTYSFNEISTGTVSVPSEVDASTLKAYVTNKANNSVEERTIAIVDGKYDLPLARGNYEVRFANDLYEGATEVIVGDKAVTIPQIVIAKKTTAITVNGGSAITGGSVDVVSTSDWGETVTATVTANTGYEIASVSVNGAPVSLTEGKYSFTVNAYEYAIQVEFALKDVAITVNGGEPVVGGTVSVTEGVQWFENATVTVTPATGYKIKSVTLDGEEIEIENGEYTFKAEKDAYAVEVEFELKTVTITKNDPEQGTIEVVESAKWFDEITIRVTAQEGYGVQNVTLNGEPIVLASDGTYTFEANADAYAIEVTFALKDVDVIVNGGEEVVGGTVTVTPNVKYGDTATVTVTPATGYQLKSVTLDGEPIELDNGAYSFTANNKEYAVEVEFELKTVTITKTIENGAIEVAESAKWFDEITATVTANEGFEIASVTVNDQEVEVVGGEITFQANADTCVIVATLVRKDVTVNVNTPENGTVSVTENVKWGDTVTVTVTPNADYRVKTFTVDGKAENLSNGEYTFTASADSYEIVVEFELKNQTVTATASGFVDGKANLVINGKELKEVTIADGKFSLVLLEADYDFELVQGSKFDFVSKTITETATTLDFVARDEVVGRVSNIITINGQTYLQDYAVTNAMIEDSLDGTVTIPGTNGKYSLPGTVTAENFIAQIDFTATVSQGDTGFFIQSADKWIEFQYVSWEKAGNVTIRTRGGAESVFYAGCSNTFTHAGVANVHFYVTRSAEKIVISVGQPDSITEFATLTASGITLAGNFTSNNTTAIGQIKDIAKDFFGTDVELALGYTHTVTGDKTIDATVSKFDIVEYISADGTLTAKTVNGAEGNLSLYGSAVKMTFTHENGYTFFVNGVGVNGAFAFDEIVAGTYTVKVVHPNGATVTIGDVVVGSEAIALTANVLPEVLTASNAMTVNGLTATAGSYATTNGSTVTTSAQTNVFLPGTVTDKDFIFEASVTTALTASTKFVFAIVPGTKQDKGANGYDRIEFHIKGWDGQLGMAVRQEGCHGADDFSTSDIPGARGQNSNFKIRIERIDNELTVYVARQVGVVDAPFVKVVTLNTSGVQLQTDYSITYTFSGLSFDTVNARLANMLASSTEELGVMMVAPACESTVTYSFNEISTGTVTAPVGVTVESAKAIVTNTVNNAVEVRDITVTNGAYALPLARGTYDIQIKSDIYVGKTLGVVVGDSAIAIPAIELVDRAYALVDEGFINGKQIKYAATSQELYEDSLDGSFTLSNFMSYTNFNRVMLNTATAKNFTWDVTLTSENGAGMPGITIFNGTTYIYIQVESWRNHGQNIVVGVTNGNTNDNVYNTTDAGNTNTLNSLTYKVVRTQDSITLYASGAEIMTFTKDGYTFKEGVATVGDDNYATHQTNLANFFGENMEMAVGFGSNGCSATYTCTSVFTINA